MAITVSDIQDNFNTIIGDTSTDRISAAERLQYITEATVWLMEELENEHQNSTYTLNYLDTVNYYKVTSSIADLLDGADLRREKDDHDISFQRRSAREIAEDIGQGDTNSTWAIERRDGDAYLVINHQSKNSAKTVADMDSTTAGGGTWAVDSTNSDATNLTTDTVEYKQGSASLNFDIDVSQSGNDRATIQNTTLDSMDLSDYEDLASWIFWVYIPDVTNFTSVTLYWGSDTSNYWSATATTDIDGASFSNGWNRIKIDWADATKTSSPDVTAIDYIRFDFNYGAGQTDDTDFRIDDLKIVTPEKLTFHYISWNVGTDSSGNDITAFTATTDIPYFSGQYDNYKFPVAHKAASLAYKSLRLFDESVLEENEAIKALRRLRKIIPSSKTPESKGFKVSGINFRK